MTIKIGKYLIIDYLQKEDVNLIDHTKHAVGNYRLINQ